MKFTLSQLMKQAGSACLAPRTPRDVRQFLEWVSWDYTEQQLVQEMSNPYWRSEVVEYRAHLFCNQCVRLIDLEECLECGQTTSAILPEISDVEAYYLKREAAARAKKRYSEVG